MIEKHKVHHEHEKHKVHHEHKTTKVKKSSMWQLISAVLGILLIISIFTGGFNMKKGVGGTLTAEQAADKAVNFINNNLLQAGVSASVLGVEDRGDLYSAQIDIGGR